MTDSLLIIFVKNSTLGKVKTRLAKTIGDQAAFDIYKDLVAITEHTTLTIEVDKHVYFSDAIVDTKWEGIPKTVQQGNDLGERMKHAFQSAFDIGYKHVVLIGSDLPDITANHINKAFEKLQTNSVVFGPADDGGYYLVGMNKAYDFIFDQKPWSQPELLKITLDQLRQKQVSFSTLATLNDIDTFDDLIASDFYRSNRQLQHKLSKFHDQTDKKNR